MKKKIGKKKINVGLYFVIGFVLIIGLSAIISNSLSKPEKYEFNEILYSDYKNIIKSEGTHIVFLGYPECPWCTKISPFLNDVQEKFDVVVNYLNTNTMSQNDYDDLATTAEVFEGQWGTPTIVVFKDGKLLNYFSGFREKPVVEKFVEESLNGNKFDVDSYNPEENSEVSE